jgi:glycosyltransferase involved in cell wall biosynthesis
MKLAVTSPGTYPYVLGGIQRHTFNLVRHLAKLGVEIDLYHTDFKTACGIDGLNEMSKAEKSKITSISIPWPTGDHLPGHYVRNLRRFSHQAYQHYQQRSPADFIYGQSLTAWSFVEAKAEKMALPPIGVNLHGYEMFQPSTNAKAFLKNFMLRSAFKRHACQADYVFSLGGKLTNLIQEKLGIPSDNIFELNVGIDASWLTPDVHPVSTPRRFLFLGRYERRKGIEELQSVIQSHPEWQQYAQFRFIGPIPEHKRLKQPHVSYADVIMNQAILKKELRSADVLLCPSHSEGMPTVILEAMASGLAILATDVGAVELMVNSENGIRLPRLTIFDLTEGIKTLIELAPSKILSMKRSSLNRVHAFAWEKVALKTLESVQTIIEKETLGIVKP